MKTTDQITEEARKAARGFHNWYFARYQTELGCEDELTERIKAAIEKAYRQGGEDTTQAALNTFLPMVKQEIAARATIGDAVEEIKIRRAVDDQGRPIGHTAARASESEPWKPISQGGKADEPHDIRIDGQHCIEVGRDRQTVQVICNAHNATLGAQSADTKRLDWLGAIQKRLVTVHNEMNRNKNTHISSPTLRQAIDAAMSQEQPIDLEAGGKLVRDTWIAWAKEQPNVKSSWLVPWEELSEPDKEVDRRIYAACRAARATEPWTPQMLSRLFDAECSPEQAIERICSLHNATLQPARASEENLIFIEEATKDKGHKIRILTEPTHLEGLAICDRCNGGEVELDEPCAERLAKQLSESRAARVSEEPKDVH